jgi:hypothetical protein
MATVEIGRLHNGEYSITSLAVIPAKAGTQTPISLQKVTFICDCGLLGLGLRLRGDDTMGSLTHSAKLSF